MLKISSVKMNLILVIFSILAPGHGVVTFKDGGYSRARIIVDEKLPIENCRTILGNLEVCTFILFHIIDFSTKFCVSFHYKLSYFLNLLPMENKTFLIFFL